MKHIQVVAAVIINNGKVFSAQRNGKGEVGYKWEFPGGKIEPGEAPQEALRRELQEELGIQTRIGDFITTITHTYQTFALTMHCYCAHIVSGTLELKEHVDSRWLAPDELELVDWAPADIPVLAKVREMLR